MSALHPPIDARASGLFLRRRVDSGWHWLLLRGRSHGEWGFPKGHLDPGEGLLAAALRECAEETGIGLVALDAAAYELMYELTDHRRKIVTYFGATTAQDTVTLSKEHQASAWCPGDVVLKRLAHANLRSVFADHIRQDCAGPRA